MSCKFTLFASEQFASYVSFQDNESSEKLLLESIVTSLPECVSHADKETNPKIYVYISLIIFIQIYL